MACDICGGGACANWMHSAEEQARFEDVIDAFDKARELRDQVRNEEVEEQPD